MCTICNGGNEPYTIERPKSGRGHQGTFTLVELRNNLFLFEGIYIMIKLWLRTEESLRIATHDNLPSTGFKWLAVLNVDHMIARLCCNLEISVLPWFFVLLIFDLRDHPSYFQWCWCSWFGTLYSFLQSKAEEVFSFYDNSWNLSGTTIRRKESYTNFSSAFLFSWKKMIFCRHWGKTTCTLTLTQLLEALSSKSLQGLVRHQKRHLYTLIVHQPTEIKRAIPPPPPIRERKSWVDRTSDVHIIRHLTRQDNNSYGEQ